MPVKSNADENNISGLTAIGSSQTTSFVLFLGTFHQFSTVPPSTGAILPSGQLPQTLSVANGGSNALLVYPPVGGTLNGGSLNAAYSLAAGATAIFSATDLLTWIANSGNASVPSTGLELDQFASKITSDTAVANTFTCDLSVSNWHTCTLGATNTIAVANGVTGQQFTIVLVQDATGSRTVTWFNTIKWAGGSPPTLTTTASKADIVTLKITGTNTYYGMIAGQNF